MLLTESRLAYYFEIHMQRQRAIWKEKEDKIWKELQDRLYQKYLDQGFNMWFSQVKAEHEVLELRNLPKGDCHEQRT